MRTRRRWWIVLSIAALVVGMGALLWIGRVSRAPRLPKVGLKRESLGQFPRQSGAHQVATAFPVDLNDDGETEAVAVFERLTSQRGEPCVWSDLKGQFKPLPVSVLSPPRTLFYALQPTGELNPPLLPTNIMRELLGWDESSKQIVRIQRQGSRFLTAPAAELQFERFPVIHWMDADEDGALETLFAEWQPSQLAFRLDREGRWNALSEMPTNPSQVANALHKQVSKVQTLPTGQTQITTPVEFFYQQPRPTVLLPDGDGDRIPEQLDVMQRTIRFSKGGTAPFPHPFAAGEQILVAELDGVEPPEILYASRADDPAKFGFQCWVYRLQDGELQSILLHKVVGVHYLALTVKDLDGDGRDEIIGNTGASRNKTRWWVWRFEDGALQVQAAEHPVPLERLDGAHWLIAGRDTLAGESTHLLSEWALRLNPLDNSEQGSTALLDFSTPSTYATATILVGLPEGEHRADPKHWSTLAVDGKILWRGDYDGDGVEEYVLSNFSDGGAIAQFC
ncbi:MAG: hypothetical protein ACK4UU_05475, partial [Fimbriimonadales bacterium]